jgi:DNA-binding transcriptional LysR family regulator
MLPLFRRLIAEFDTAVARARESVNRTKSVVRLACLPSCAATLLPDVIREFAEGEPGVTFVVQDVINSMVPGLVRSSQVDFGIAVRDPQQADLEWRPLFSDSLHVVYGSHDPAFASDTITAASLASRPLILMVRGSSVREKVDEAFAAAGLTALAACEVNHMFRQPQPSSRHEGISARGRCPSLDSHAMSRW